MLSTSHSIPNMLVIRSARVALYSSDSATTEACTGRPARERHFWSCTVSTLLLTTTCVCNFGSPLRES
ncbi:hypothetical protein HNR12_005515 [Streptomonospora nanhaiensis]|uniref:Uncharacterized protein n=1 Tax=Streptomonospora nanhaiensis TaxID=1323731 RepID=A0A853BVC3_9ACTN|nr:hypothetical protein [Streptomonospora nanhaiensis]